jgi:ethanolamine utilization protein EutQ (cupin superfamily)
MLDMAVTPSQVRKFSTAVGDDSIRFSGDIVIAPALGVKDGGPMSAYTSVLNAGARADLPAPYTEVWVVLSGVLRVGDANGTVTVRGGEFVHIPEQAPGTVEALEDTTMVCVSAPAH